MGLSGNKYSFSHCLDLADLHFGLGEFTVSR